MDRDDTVGPDGSLQQPAVLGFCAAQPRDGGGGALYVLLRSTTA